MAEIVSIDRMSYGSAAVGRLESGKAVFVEGAVPGDVVSVEIEQEKKSFARGRVAEVLEPSPERVVRPECQAACSGCPWRDLTYGAQLAAKRANVVDALVKNARFPRERAEQLVGQTLPSKPVSYTHLDVYKRQILERLADDLKDVAVIENAPKMEGRNMHMLIAPLPAAAKKKKEKNEGKDQQDA